MTIRDNLLRLLALAQAAKDNAVDLDTFIEQTDCGTTHCLLGLAATDPFFQAEGLMLRPEQYWPHDRLKVHGRPPDSAPQLATLFGYGAWGSLFELYGEGAWDGDIFDGMEVGPSHKELAIARLELQLLQYPA